MVIALRNQELDCLVRLAVARAVGVEIVEEAAGDDAARCPQPGADGIVVAARDDEQELGEREIRIGRSHSELVLPPDRRKSQR